MKKVFTLMLVAGVLAFAACGPTEEEAAAAQEEAAELLEGIASDLEEAADDMEEATDEDAGEMLADHVCSDKCTEDGCWLAHGEKGHECGEECTAMGGDEEGDSDEG